MSKSSLHDRPLPQWIVDKLNNPPPAGSGIHSHWLYPCACALKAWRRPQEMHEILTQAAKKCNRLVTDHEVTDAVVNSKSDFVPDGLRDGVRIMVKAVRPTRGVHGWPHPDWTEIAKIAAGGTGLVDLWHSSPAPLNREIDVRGEIMDALFPGDPLLCFGPDGAFTQLKSEWKLDPGWPRKYNLMVPSVMQAIMGKNRAGRPSFRSLENVGHRTFLVVEFDFQPAKKGELRRPFDEILDRFNSERHPRGSADLCAGILMRLKEEGAPLVLAVHSGGKSLHGWFPTFGAPDDTLKPFFRRVCRLGADTATWTRNQLVRVPMGTREVSARRQQIYYFNPGLLGA